MGAKPKFQIARSLDERIKRIVSKSHDQDTEFNQVSIAYILGFNYDNVTSCVGLTTNYQLSHAVFPIVGLVFFFSSPSAHDIQLKLSSIEEYFSSPNGLGSFKSDKNERLFLVYGTNADSKSIEKRIFNYSTGDFVRPKKTQLIIINDPYCPKQVYNGSESDPDSSIDGNQIDHLVFFIHGVGGICDSKFRSCVEVVADFKKMINSLLAQYRESPSNSSSPTQRRFINIFKRSSSRDSEDSDQLSPKIGRVECLPVSWHSLTRRQTGLNEHLGTSTMSSVPKMRQFLNKVATDALLYSSGPIYTQTIINNVGNEINRLYTLFMEKHPTFKGSVSLAGHSLGTVILFDLLTHQIDNSPESTFHEQAGPSTCPEYKDLNELLKDLELERYADLLQREHIDLNNLLMLTDLDLKELRLPLIARRKLETYINYKNVHQFSIDTQGSNEANYKFLLNNMKTGQFLIKYPQLKFKPRCFFAFGSPAPMFLNTRGILKLDPDYHLPTCSRMLNIFHPYDPLAYRFETHIDPRFKSVEPVLVPHHRGGKRMHVQLYEGFTRVGHDIRHRFLSSFRNAWTSFTRTGSHEDIPPISPLRSQSVDETACKSVIMTSLIEGSANEDLSHSDTESLPDSQTQNPGTSRSCVKNNQEQNQDMDETFDPSKVGRLNGGRRVDYVLQEKPIELFNEYIFAFASHANYWQNEDSAMMILNEIYQVDGVQLIDSLE